MHRAQPVQSKVLERKWVDLQAEVHNKRIRDVKSSVDSRSKHRNNTYHNTSKKETLIEFRNTEIERENRILLEKMA